MERKVRAGRQGYGKRSNRLSDYLERSHGSTVVAMCDSAMYARCGQVAVPLLGSSDGCADSTAAQATITEFKYDSYVEVSARAKSSGSGLHIGQEAGSICMCWRFEGCSISRH